MKTLTIRQAKNDKEIREVFAIRKGVFVAEQKTFQSSDVDDNDLKSTHLLAELNGQIVGTVRVFPVNQGNGHWIGGRLAVKKEYRSYRVGKQLVREAMRYVRRSGCTKFTAHIQVENVPFFSRLGWRAYGSVEQYFDRPHQLMEADLDLV